MASFIVSTGPSSTEHTHSDDADDLGGDNAYDHNDTHSDEEQSVEDEPNPDGKLCINCTTFRSAVV